MLSNPYPGTTCQVWYRESNRGMPYHGMLARVVIRGQGRPKNHLVKIMDGPFVVVPCGNLRHQQIKQIQMDGE